MARRATFVNNHKNKTHGLFIDAGGFNFGSGTLNKFKTEFMLQGLKQLGYSAINLSWRDLIHGPDFLGEMQNKKKSPFVSANIFIKETGRQFSKSYTIEKVTVIDTKSGKKTKAKNKAGFRSRTSSTDREYI